MIEQLHARIAQLEQVVFTTPLWFRKDLERVLGVSPSTITRKMKRRTFPKPAMYDAGRPKWRPSDFAGQPGQTVCV